MPYILALLTFSASILFRSLVATINPKKEVLQQKHVLCQFPYCAIAIEGRSRADCLFVLFIDWMYLQCRQNRKMWNGCQASDGGCSSQVSQTDRNQLHRVLVGVADGSRCIQIELGEVAYHWHDEVPLRMLGRRHERRL